MSAEKIKAFMKDRSFQKACGWNFIWLVDYDLKLHLNASDRGRIMR